MDTLKKMFPFIFIIIVIILKSTSTMSLELTTPHKIQMEYKGTEQTLEITSLEDIDYIVSNLNSIKFETTQKPKAPTFGHDLSFYDEDNNIIANVYIIDEITIEYEDTFYKSVDNRIDLRFLNNLLERGV